MGCWHQAALWRTADLIGMGLCSAPQRSVFNSIRQGESKYLQKAAENEELHMLLAQKYTEPCKNNTRRQLLILIAVSTTPLLSCPVLSLRLLLLSQQRYPCGLSFCLKVCCLKKLNSSSQLHLHNPFVLFTSWQKGHQACFESSFHILFIHPSSSVAFKAPISTTVYKGKNTSLEKKKIIIPYTVINLDWIPEISSSAQGSVAIYCKYIFNNHTVLQERRS